MLKTVGGFSFCTVWVCLPAVIIWNMLTKKETYKPYDTTKIESQIRDKQIRKINKLMQLFKVNASEIKFVYT